jgi:hypothetical protein
MPFSYQILAAGPPASYALASGSLPPGVTLNTSTGLLSGTPTSAGTFTPAFTVTNSIGTSAAVTITLNVSAIAGVIIHEPFAYTIGANNPDPDAGLNGGNGLPATNVGGTPSGLSTGLRNTWGTTTDTVAGLSYTQGSKTLTTSGGAGRVNNADWGSATPTVYRRMTTDPFLALRIGASNETNFGVDGSSFFISFLGSTSSTTADAFRFSFRYDQSNNFFVSNAATGWKMTSQSGATATAPGVPALNTPTLFVMRFDFAPGATDTVNLWVNPTLGAALGAPNAVVSGIDFPGLANFQTRPTVANAMTFDELRIGTSFTAVTPYIDSAPATGLVTFRSANGLAANGSQDLLTPANDDVENLLKFAFNMIGSGTGQAATLATPNSAVLAPTGSAGLPLATAEALTGKLQLTYIRRKPASNPGISYSVQFSDALSSWNTNPSATESSTSLDAIFERVTVTDSTAPSQRFARVKITAP